MSTMVPELPAERPESFGDNLAGMGSFLVDPAGAARRVFSKWFWLGPLIVVSIVGVVAGLIRMPIAQHVLETMPMPPNATPEQYQRGISIGMMVQRIFVWCSPVLVAILYAFSALILFALSSVMGVKAKFQSLFNLIAGCSLIQALAALAGAVILKAKGEVSTMAELQPALGLDIFAPEGTNKFLVAILGYFSIFEIWWIIMMVLIYSVAFKVSKGKAFMVIVPLIFLTLLVRILGAAFQRT
jgi:hypothetical protein